MILPRSLPVVRGALALALVSGVGCGASGRNGGGGGNAAGASSTAGAGGVGGAGASGGQSGGGTSGGDAGASGDAGAGSSRAGAGGAGTGGEGAGAGGSAGGLSCGGEVCSKGSCCTPDELCGKQLGPPGGPCAHGEPGTTDASCPAWNTGEGTLLGCCVTSSGLCGVTDGGDCYSLRTGANVPCTPGN